MAHIACLILCLFCIFGWFAFVAIMKVISYWQRNVFVPRCPDSTRDYVSSGHQLPKTEQTALAVPGCSEMLNAPKGLGSPGNKPLMRNLRDAERPDDRDTAGNNLHDTRRAILRSLAFRGVKFPAPHHSPVCTEKATPRPAHNDPRLGTLLFVGKIIKRL